MTTPAPNEAAREAIFKAVALAMPHANPLLWQDWAEGHNVHIEPDDIIAIWEAATRAARALTQGEPAGWLAVCGPTAGCGVQYAGNLANCPNCGKANFGLSAGTTVTLAGAQAPGAMKWQAIETCPQTGFFLVTEDTAVRALWRYEGKWESPDYPAILSEWGDLIVGDDAKRLTGGRALVVSQGVREPHHWMHVPEGVPLPATPGADQ